MSRFCHWSVLLTALLIASHNGSARADNVSALRLVPFPKQVKLGPGAFALGGALVLETPAASAELLGRWVNEELQRADLAAVEVRHTAGNGQIVRLSARPGEPPARPTFRPEATPEDYVLDVTPDAIVCAAPSEAGLFHAVQTLRQLIRANRRGQALPCLSIQDWPALAWRAFQDDMTRGPSATLDTLKREVDLGGMFKMNLFAYYMEYQFAFKKHPAIGPKDGSLTVEELKALVGYAKPRHVEILGSQQSFGHCHEILSHPEYAAIRETPAILSPAKEETYRFLDDLYSEVVPTLPLPWFNVCCDETEGLNDTTGPSQKAVAASGPGSVYVQHMCRLHDLLKNRYGKRMMMWGDIILQHPDRLGQIPKDTIMLTWAYDPRPNFESHIIPFGKAGYEFFVCPGVDDWCRILPDFAYATTNIQNFVRDGAKHRALGMLNTEWKDDAETLRGALWHGYAWGAECAWNASVTDPKDFNRRIGAVLFGEKRDHFGQAIELLAKTHRLPVAKFEGMLWPAGIQTGRFWVNDFVPKGDKAAVRALAEPLLALIRPAIEHLEACKKDATANAELLDDFLYGARRMELIGRRMIDGVEAAKAYTEAMKATRRDDKLAKLAKVEHLTSRNRNAFESLGKEFTRIWLSQSKPYALDRTMARYAEVVKWYDALLAKLADARRRAEAGQPLPAALQLGLALP